MCMKYLGWTMNFVYHTLNLSGRRNKSIAIMKMTKIAIIILDDS